MNKKIKTAISSPDFIIYILLIIAATALRLYQLDARPFHHDESAVGSFTYTLFTRGEYQYNPVFHGPFLYFLTSRVFELMGDSDFSARFVPALTGVGMVLLVYPMRRYLGRPGWLITAFFLAFSPSFLYYSRFFRNDIFITFFTLAAVICGIKYFEKGNNPGRLVYLALASAALGFSVTAKENAYITMALFSFPAGLYLLYQTGMSLRRRSLAHDSTLFFERNMFRILLDTSLFTVVFLSIFVLFYSYFFKDMGAVSTATYKAFSHWYEMHSMQRIGGPPYYYLPLLALYELPVFIFALIGSIKYGMDFIKTRENPVMCFIVYWFLSSLAAYSYVGEKVPWLILHPLLPAVLIAGAYIGETLPNLKKRPVNAGFARFFRSVMVELLIIMVLVLSSSFFLYTSYNLNYINHSNPAEPLIQASQPPQKFAEFISTLNSAAKKHKGYGTEIQVTDSEVETQMLWYMRYYTNIKWRVDLEKDPPLTAPIIIVHDVDAEYVEKVLSDRYIRLDSARMAWYFFKLSDINTGFIMNRWLDRQQSEYGIVLFYM